MLSSVQLEIGVMWTMRPAATKLLLLLSMVAALGDSQFILAQLVTTFEGIDASQLANPKVDVDPNGAVGTKQFMEWTNVYYQAFDKVTLNPVWASPRDGASPWKANGLNNCASITGDGVIIFDRMASRWVLAAHNSPGTSGNYYYCVAVSSTDDLTSGAMRWYTYAFYLNAVLGSNSSGHPYFPDWPKIASWANGYYVAFDLLDVDNHYQPIGALVCALDRTRMLTGATPRPPQCFTDPTAPPSSGRYLSHSLIPADVEGASAPPVGRDEFLVSLQNPPLDGTTTNSSAINLWDFHVDWVTPAQSTFTDITLNVPTYTPGCYNLTNPGRTFCVPEPALMSNGTHRRVDAVGDRLMPRFAYRNVGTYESFLVSHTVRVGNQANQRTGVRWYELRGNSVPSLYQSGTISPDTALFRFVPSIAQDHVGNAAVGYSISSASVHPGIRASWWNLVGASAAEFPIYSGKGDEENAVNWGDYTSLTIDPVDDCTFWYIDQYFVSNQTGSSINWNTRIANFKLPACQ